jgi:ABC-type oligopeptide transport system substrate-binding subunit
MKKIALSLSLVLLISMSITSCGEEPKKEKTEVEMLQEKFDMNMKETIAIHDEVMPKMSEINNLLSELEMQSPKMNQEEYQLTSSRLQESYMQMMSWMKKFSANFDTKEVNSGITSEKIDVLKEKNEQLSGLKKEAEEMRNNVLSSLKSGKELAKKYK